MKQRGASLLVEVHLLWGTSLLVYICVAAPTLPSQLPALVPGGSIFGGVK